MWQIPVLLRVITANVVTPVILKKVTDLNSRSRRFVSMYTTAAIIAWIYTLVMGLPSNWMMFGLIMLIGFIQSFGTYCQWRAYAISMSKTSLTTQLDDLVGIMLGYLFLGELVYLANAQIVIGIGLVFLGGTLYLFASKKNVTSFGKSDRHLIQWVLGYSFLWGMAYFAIRTLALKEVPVATFLSGWYSGSLLGSLVIFKLAGKQQAGDPISRTGHLWAVVLAVLIFVCLYLQFWAASLSPITIHQPIYQVTELIFPALLGLYYFKEIKTLRPIGKLAFTICIIGMILIAISYQ